MYIFNLYVGTHLNSFPTPIAGLSSRIICVYLHVYVDPNQTSVTVQRLSTTTCSCWPQHPEWVALIDSSRDIFA
jgi:hypothetical protein